MVSHTVAGESYHVNNRLYGMFTEKTTLERLKKKNKDRVYIIDGTEGVGKSTFAFQQAGVLDPNMFKDVKTFLSRICFTPEAFFNAVRTVKNGVIIFDEAFRGLSSRSALSKVNKRIVQALMEMRQNNNIVFIVLPSFFLLDIYPAMLRSNGLFHIYEDKRNDKTAWMFYNKDDKGSLYQLGLKRGWKYIIKGKLSGYFYNKFPGGDLYRAAYEKKKSESLREMDQEDERLDKKDIQLARMTFALKTELKLSEKVLAARLKKYRVEISPATVGQRYRKIREEMDRMEKSMIPTT